MCFSTEGSGVPLLMLTLLLGSKCSPVTREVKYQRGVSSTADTEEGRRRRRRKEAVRCGHHTHRSWSLRVNLRLGGGEEEDKDGGDGDELCTFIQSTSAKEDKTESRDKPEQRE